MATKPAEAVETGATTTTTNPEKNHVVDAANEKDEKRSLPVESDLDTLPPTKEDAVPTEEVEEDMEYATGWKLMVVLACVTCVAFVMLLDMSIIVTAIPQITTEFHSLEDVGWYGASYQLASAALQPLTGKMYAQFKSKWTFLAFLLLFEVGSLLCGVATSSKMFIAGRAVAGMGGSGLFNGALTIITASVPMEKRPITIGIMMGLSQMALIVGPLIGGAFTEYATWRWCFYINLPIGGVVTIFLLLVKIPNHLKPTESAANEGFIRVFLTRLDLPGFILFAPAGLMFLLALQFGGSQFAWNSATVIGLFVGSAGMLAVFLFWEHRVGDDAMIPFSMVRKRAVWTSAMLSLAVMGTLFISAWYLPIYFQAVRGVSPWTSGVYLLPSILSQLIGAVGSGFVVGKLGYYLPWAVASGVLTAIGNGLVSTFTPTTSTGQWIGYQILIGAGRGIGMQMPILAVQANLPPSQISVAMAFVIFLQNFGSSCVLTFCDLIFTERLRTELESNAPRVNFDALLLAGAAAVRRVVSPEDLPGVLYAYTKAVNSVFYLAIGCSIIGFVVAWGTGWKDIRSKKPAAAAEA